MNLENDQKDKYHLKVILLQINQECYSITSVYKKVDNWINIMKQFYHVDSLFKAEGYLWLCNEIKYVEYEEIKD